VGFILFLSFLHYVHFFIVEMISISLILFIISLFFECFFIVLSLIIFVFFLREEMLSLSLSLRNPKEYNPCSIFNLFLYHFIRGFVFFFSYECVSFTMRNVLPFFVYLKS